MNTRGSSNFSDRYNIVVGFIGGITIASSGLTFRVLASSTVPRQKCPCGGHPKNDISC